MSFLTRLRSFLAQVSPLNPRRGQGWYVPWQYLPDGVRLSTHQMVSVGAAWACMDLIATSIAAAPVNVFSVNEGRREKLPSDNLDYLLNVRPNDDTTAEAFKEGVLLQTLAHGNAYAEVIWDRASRPIALHGLLTEQMLPPGRDSQGRLVYQYADPDRGNVLIPPENMLHFRGPSLDSLMGVSVAGLATKAIAHGAACERFSIAWLANGATPSGILTSAKPVGPAQINALRSEFIDTYLKPDRAGVPMVLGAGMDFKSVASDPQKSQLVETQEFSVRAICRFFRVNPLYVADKDSAQGYGNNIETNGLDLVRLTLRPWVCRLTQEANYKLIPDRVSKIIEIDLTHLTYGTWKERAEANEILIRSGQATPNEVRESLGKNHGPPELDNFFLTSTVKTVDQIVNPPEPPAPVVTPNMPAADEKAPMDMGGKTPVFEKTPKQPASAVVSLLVLALEAHARRFRARVKDLRSHHQNGHLEPKLLEARTELRAQLAKELGEFVEDPAPLAEAVEQGAEPAQVAQRFIEVQS